MTTISIDSGPLTQDQIDNIKVLLDMLGYSSARRNKETFALNLKPVESNLLSSRQIQICKHLSNGLYGKEVCEELGISKTTLKRDMLDIFNKLGVSSATHAISTLFRLKILD